MRLLLVAFTIAILASCSSGPNYVIKTLPSGKQVKVISVGKMFFSQYKPALILKYQTDLPLSNKPALEKEVDEIWLSFQADVDKTALASAIISATEKPSGFIIRISKSQNFGYTKSPDGQWSRSR